MRPRSAVSAVCVLLVGAGLAGCGKEPLPEVAAFADPVALSTYQQESFAAQLERMDAAVDARQPYTGDQPLNAKYNSYNHIGLGEDDFGKEAQSVIVGQPPAFASEYASNREGNTLNNYHPAGSEWIYFLLGERYASIAPTPWVAIPYSEPKGGDAPYTKAYCDTPPLNYVCTIRGAIDVTANSNRAGDTQPHVSLSADGHTELRTQVTWDSLVNNPLASVTINEQTLAKLPDGIEDQLVPVRLWLDDRGFPIKGEINIAYGEDESKFQLQCGFEYLGPATDADFPEPPSVIDLTQMDSDDFFTEVATLDAEANR